MLIYIYVSVQNYSGVGKEDNTNPCKSKTFGPILAKLKCKLSIRQITNLKHIIFSTYFFNGKVFEIWFADPDRYIQSSIHGKRCLTECKKDKDQKFHYCETSPWHIGENVFHWDLCSHKIHEKEKLGN